MTKRIAHIVVGLPVEGPFDYLLPEAFRGAAQPGMRVLVSFGRRKMVGIILALSSRSSFPELKPVLALLDEDPVFTPEFLKFGEVFSLRFGCSLGEALMQCLPPYLRGAKKLTTSPQALPPAGPGTGKALTRLVFDRGLEKRWEVVLPRIAQALAQGMAVICVVPDGTQVPSVMARLSAAGHAPVLLPQATDKKEFEVWNTVREGKALLAVGFISAVLAPARAPGLVVIVDEESPFYKHDQSPFYHAREAALLRARLEKFEVMLVTSAPSLEAWYEADAGRAELTLLDEALPPVRFLDLRNFKMKKDTFLSSGLRHHVEWALKEGRRVLLYIQAARGVAGVIDEARRYWPAARVAGYDRTGLELPQDAEIIVGTQAILRHRQQSRFGVIVVLDIDWEFHKADYRAAQAAFALTQHLRQMATAFVLLQTRHMESELLHFLADDDVRKFYRKELGLRKEMDLPPFRYLVALVVRSSDPQLAESEAKRFYGQLLAFGTEGIEWHEPQQDRSAIVRGKFRWCVMGQARSLRVLMESVRQAQKSFRGKRDTIVTVNVNP